VSEKNSAREKQIEKSKTEKVNYRMKGVVRDNSWDDYSLHIT